jgi:hypothetical protein
MEGDETRKNKTQGHTKKKKNKKQKKQENK